MTVIDLLRTLGIECHTRTDWGSPREKDGSYARRRTTHPMPRGPAPYHFLHITVTRDTDTVAEGAAGARQIEGYGYSSPPMVSYQDLVTNEGRYFQGQDYGTKGTHTVNDKSVPGYPRDLNLYGYATALMQNVGDPVTDTQVSTIGAILAAREVLGLVHRDAPLLPHRMFANKSCPGDLAVARMDDIRTARTIHYRTLTEDDMPLTADEIKTVAAAAADAVWAKQLRYTGNSPDTRQAARLLREIHANAIRSRDLTRDLTKSITRNLGGTGIGVEALEAAVAAGIRDVLGSLDDEQP